MTGPRPPTLMSSRMAITDERRAHLLKCSSDILGFPALATCANTVEDAHEILPMLHYRRCHRQLLYLRRHHLGGELDHSEQRIIAGHFPAARRNGEKAEPSLDVV